MTVLSASSLLGPQPNRGFTQTVSPEAAQAALQQSVCLNDWHQAIYAVNLLIGSSSTSPAMREQWVRYRRQLQDYQTLRTTFDMSHSAECAAAIAQARQAAAAQPAVPARPLDWDRATAGFRQSPAIAQSRSQVTTPAASGRSTASRNSANCGDLMNPGSSERRVATGSVSSRWNYAIFQESSNQYYLRHWEQADCNRQGTTRSYSTQQDAYRAFICRHVRERCED
ncbi:MAG: hypothetical protein D6742_11030 [Cyanobacteria bacterium J069]|nr:MAG: hypothetical protein D6742_11030 [Cyanobacteria bacterium J069]